MRYRVGKCPVCEERHPIVSSHNLRKDVRLPPAFAEQRHIVMAYHQAGTPAFGCNGRWMVPVFDAALERERGRRLSKKRALVEPFRIHASAALDAWVESRPFPAADRRILVAVSVFEYRLHYPSDSTTSAAVRYVGAMNGANKTRVGDCYCSFCGELLVRGVKSARFGRMEPARLVAIAERNHHAIRCALEHLTHGHVPDAPDVRRLPAEYVVDEASA